MRIWEVPPSPPNRQALSDVATWFGRNQYLGVKPTERVMGKVVEELRLPPDQIEAAIEWLGTEAGWFDDYLEAWLDAVFEYLGATPRVKGEPSNYALAHVALVMFDRWNPDHWENWATGTGFLLPHAELAKLVRSAKAWLTKCLKWWERAGFLRGGNLGWDAVIPATDPS